MWDRCKTPTSVLQGRVEKLYFVFPHVRPFPSGCPLLSFLLLFSFFTLPIPDGVGLHDPAAIGAGGSGFVFMNELQNLAFGVIATQQMGSIMNAHRLVQVLTRSEERRVGKERRSRWSTEP